MPPRAVRRPATATSLKKKLTPPKSPTAALQPPPPEAEHNPNNQDSSSPRKEEEERGEIDTSEKLQLEDNSYQFETAPPTRMDDDNDEDEREPEEVVEYESVDGDDDDNVIEADEKDVNAIHGEDVVGGDEEEQVEEEHHDMAKERRKRKEFEIFVGGLDRDATDDDLIKVFSQVGDIAEVRLMKNPLTHKNKGFAFVRFATVDQARRAITELKNPTVNGKQCGVSPSQDSDTLFVGNICRTWTKAAFKDKLVQYGVESFEELTLVEDTINEGQNRGFAFLDFSSRADALIACKRLQKMDVVFGTDRTAKVAFADSFIEPDDEIMAQVKAVFLDGLPSSWDEDRVVEHLMKFGKVEKVELARNMPAAKRTDFGFITFETHDVAVACVEGINNTEFVEGDKKVKIRARLSRPRQRGSKSSKHARGGYLVGRGGGRGGRVSWYSGVPHTESWRFAGRGGRGIPSRRPYIRDLKPPLGPRDRYPGTDVAPNRVERRGIPSPERSFGRRSQGLATEKSSLRRGYVRHGEEYPSSSSYASRIPTERPISYRDAYTSRGSEYRVSPPPRSAQRSAVRRPPSYDDESYERHMERPSSYRDSHSRDYGSLSSSKRPHSSMEEYHSRYTEPAVRETRARYDHRGNAGHSPYEDDAYGNETTRPGRGSHLGYDSGSRSSASRSHNLFDSRTASMGYGRDEVSRGDDGGMYSNYDRAYVSKDYSPTGENVGAASYSSLYSSRRISDTYTSGRGSGSYY